MALNQCMVCIIGLVLASVLVTASQIENKGKDTPVNLVSEKCPHGEFFYRACVRCPCEAMIPQEVKEQYPEQHIKVCRGESQPTDCPDFTCATSKSFLEPTPCEGSCECDPDTKITTCKRHPCPYE